MPVVSLCATLRADAFIKCSCQIHRCCLPSKWPVAEGAASRSMKGAENRLTLSHTLIVAMMDEVGEKIPCGLAKQWCTTHLPAKMMHLTVHYAIFALGA